MSVPTSPITKRRHARTPALTQGSVAGSTSSFTSFSAAAGRGSISAASGQTVQLDPMAVHDADTVLEKMNVREAVSWESQVRATHTALSTSLRTLVSERYRDMLQTANTIIDMGASSASLSTHLSNVLAATERACEQSQSGASALKREPEQKLGQDERDREELALTASLRLVQEAPAALWEAVTPSAPAAGPAKATGAAERNAVAAKEAGPAAGAMLRAAWICCAATKVWENLESEKADIAKLFPYVASQYASLPQLRERITSRATQGLMDAPTYAATTTLLLAIALLQSLDARSALANLLETRLSNLATLLKAPTQAPAEALGAGLRAYSTTLIQARRAFLCNSTNSGVPHFLALLQATLEPDAVAISDPALEAPTSPTTAKSSASRRKSSYGFASGGAQAATPAPAPRKRFPPTAYAVLQSMPSGSLASHLPKAVKGLVPSLPAPQLERGSVEEALSAWSRQVQSTWSAQNLAPLVEKLASLRSLGAAQVAIRAALDEALAEAKRLGKEGEDVASESKAFAQTLLQAVHERMKAVQSVRAGDMVSGLENSTHAALEKLQEQEGSLLAFMLEPASQLRRADSSSSTSAIASQLALRTPSLDAVLSEVERLATFSGSDASAYERRVARHARNVVRRSKDAQRGQVDRDADIASMRTLQTHVVKSACGDLVAKLEAMLEEGIEAPEAAAPDEEGEEEQQEVSAEQLQQRERVIFIGRIAAGLAQSDELRKALWPESTSAAQSEEPAALQQLRSDLFRLRARSLEGWQVRTAQAAVKLGYSLPMDADAEGPSAGVQYALISLADALHQVGIAYAGEENLIRGLLGAFVAAWIGEPANEHTTDVGVAYDLELLRALKRFAGASEDEDLEKQRLLMRSSNVLPEDFAQKAELLVPQCLAKLRLQLAPLLIGDAATFVQSNNEAAKTTSTAPAPATPLIALAQPKSFFEPLPAVRAK